MMCPAAKVASLIGRPRDFGRDEAIHQAALALLSEVGYDRTTVEAIAHRAQVGKATIYRRFKNKEEILMSAMREHAACTLPQIDTGSVRNDLIALISEHVKLLNGPEGELMMSLLAIAHRDPELGKLLNQKSLIESDQESAELFNRAIARGEISEKANIAFLTEVVPSIITQRIFITHQQVNQKFIEQLVDDVLIPALNKK
jgi:AcrR family transcriptional regulator